MKNVGAWLSEHPIIAVGALLGFVGLTWAVGFDNAMALLNSIAGE